MPPLAGVLVVDDEPHVAAVLHDAPMDLGCAVRMVADGPAALEIVPVYRPDVVLLDLTMPAMARRHRPQTNGRPLKISDEIQAFIRQHRGDGQFVGDATEPLPNGYQLTITCPCGVLFIRWVTPEDAAIDLAALARLN